ANPADSVRANTPGASASVRPPRALTSQPLAAARLAGSWLRFALGCWAGGAALVLIWLVVGQLRLRQLRRHWVPLGTPEWQGMLRNTCRALGLRRAVTLLQGDESAMPATWGWRRPVILLPTSVANWPPERRRIVLLHELAHVKRWDCLTQTVARLVC